MKIEPSYKGENRDLTRLKKMWGGGNGITGIKKLRYWCIHRHIDVDLNLLCLKNYTSANLSKMNSVCIRILKSVTFSIRV